MACFYISAGRAKGKQKIATDIKHYYHSVIPNRIDKIKGK